MNKRIKFLQVYANLPLNLRQEIIVVLDDEPLSWQAAKIEVEQKTKKGEEILEKLTELGILK
jgi:predicted transcriptional regulator